MSRIRFTGARLMLLGRFDEALAKLQREARREIENINSGSICTIGCVYLLQGKYKKAEKYFNELMSSTASNLRNSDHFLYAGTACWFRNERDKAKRYWEEAIKAHYAGHGGFDHLLHLMYMSMRYPECFECGEYARLIERKLSRVWNRNTDSFLPRFVIGQITIEDVRNGFKETVHGSYVDAWLNRYNAYADFYEAGYRWREGSRTQFLQLLESCVGRSASDEFSSLEYVFARLELKQMRRKPAVASQS